MNEKLEAEFMQKGCKCRKDAAIAVQVYLELCEVKRYWDVEYLYCAELEKIYFTAKKNKTERPSIFVPIAVSEAVSFCDLQKLFQLCSNSDDQSICVVIVHPDSTCVYYQISNGLGEPPACFSKGGKDDKSQKLDADLKKNKKLLEEAALYGLAITLPKKQKCEEPGVSGSS